VFDVHSHVRVDSVECLQEAPHEAAKVNGVLDDRFGRVAPDAPGVASLGGRYTLSQWPENASWDFVAVGRGHDVEYWGGGEKGRTRRS